MKWFSLHSTHLTNWNTTHTLTPINSSNLESQMQRILMEFDRQYNFTLEMVKNYEYYQIQVRHFDLLISRSVDQLELITDENDRACLSQTMMALSDKTSTAERNQSWIKTIIKRHTQTMRNNLERYYVLRTVQQSLLALDKYIGLHQDIIYQHQFRNGKIISFPKYRIVDPVTTTKKLLTTIPITSTTTKEQTMATSSEETTEVMTTTVSSTTQPDIDWEQVNKLDKQEAEKDTGLSIPILSSILDTLITISSTIVYGVFQLCIPSNTTINSNVTSVIP